MCNYWKEKSYHQCNKILIETQRTFRSSSLAITFRM
jgi:hypothetical protein